MRFQIVVIGLEAGDRKVSSVEYLTRKDAMLDAQRSAELFEGGFEFNEQTEEWIAKDLIGREYLIFIIEA
ncbi:hypothetical protein RNI52_06340 [Labrys neptuniae]|uniref:hypothetical protein n=1 Tax=Labrys neptuniae TaxID=376174 RepID=UPI0028911C44|nr:hypothetical protein [Labrys neptuniae]MDT3376943.1 hypothetical protein [Labrys neptuniae]